MFHEKIFGITKKDEFSLAAKNDKKHGSFKHLHAHISSKMRELARLFVAARKIDGTITWLADLLCPEKFEV